MSDSYSFAVTTLSSLPPCPPLTLCRMRSSNPFSFNCPNPLLLPRFLAVSSSSPKTPTSVHTTFSLAMVLSRQYTLRSPVESSLPPVFSMYSLFTPCQCHLSHSPRSFLPAAPISRAISSRSLFTTFSTPTPTSLSLRIPGSARSRSQPLPTLSNSPTTSMARSRVERQV